MDYKGSTALMNNLSGGHDWVIDFLKRGDVDNGFVCHEMTKKDAILTVLDNWMYVSGTDIQGVWLLDAPEGGDKTSAVRAGTWEAQADRI